MTSDSNCYVAPRLMLESSTTWPPKQTIASRSVQDDGRPGPCHLFTHILPLRQVDDHVLFNQHPSTSCFDLAFLVPLINLLTAFSRSQSPTLVDLVDLISSWNSENMFPNQYDLTKIMTPMKLLAPLQSRRSER